MTLRIGAPRERKVESFAIDNLSLQKPAAQPTLPEQDVALDPGRFQGELTTKNLDRVYESYKGGPLRIGGDVKPGATTKSNKAAYEKELAALKANDNFKALPKTQQDAALKAFASLAGDPEGRQVFCRMLTSPGFRHASESSREKLIERVGGDGYFGDTARAKMKHMLDHQAYRAADARKQAAWMNEYVTGNHHSPDNVQFEADDIRVKDPKYTLSEKPVAVKRHDFLGGDAPANKYILKVGDREIPVFMAQKVDKGLEQLDVNEIARAIASLPPEVVKSIDRVDAHPRPHSRDIKDKKAGKEVTDPAFMSASKYGTLNIYALETKGEKIPQEMLVGTIVHETGHIISQRAWGAEDSSKGWDKWRAAMKADGPGPSKYGDTQLQEDFAETWQLYFEVKGTKEEKAARQTFKDRFALIDDLLASNGKVENKKKS